MHNPEFDSVSPDAATDAAAQAAPAPDDGAAAAQVEASADAVDSSAPAAEPSSAQCEGDAPESALSADATEPAQAKAAPSVQELSPAQCSARLAELFPALFCLQQPLPLKLRIQADIQARAPGVFTRKTLSAFLHRYTTGTPYLLALTRQTQRFDLDGQPAGEVAAEHLEAATTELTRRRAIVDARRAQERAAQRAAQKEAPATDNPQQPLADQRQKPARPEHRDRRPQRARPAPHKAQQAPQHRQKPGQQPEPQPQQPQQPQLAQAPEQRERAQLLRTFESSTLTRANFCALKRMTEAELEAQLALARAEAASGSQHRPPSAAQPQPHRDAQRSAGRRPTR